MLLEKYSNSKDLVELEEAVKAIDPELRIARCTLNGNKVTRADVFVDEKGNKEKINKLCALGFEKNRREKANSFNPYSISEPLRYRVVLGKRM